jgi:hypothetical protein
MIKLLIVLGLGLGLCFAVMVEGVPIHAHAHLDNSTSFDNSSVYILQEPVPHTVGIKSIFGISPIFRSVLKISAFVRSLVAA